MPFDIHGECLVENLSPIAARTSTVTGTGLDISGYKGTLSVRQNVGTVSGTSPTLDGKIQTSDTSGSGYADLSGATYTQVTATDSYQGIRVDTRACKKFIRYVGTIAGTSPSFTMGVQIVGQKAVT